MATSRARALAAIAAAAFLAATAVAQNQQAPESLLPPGFGEPVAPPPAAQAPDGATVQPLPPGPLELPAPETPPTPTPTPTPPSAAEMAQYEMPLFARRSLSLVGAIGTAEGGLRVDAFGAADGGYLQGLMRRLSAPLPSRWLSIALRRALVSRVDTPAGLNGADFAAERAWLLLRMGESVAARSVIQSVDTNNATPKYRQVAMQAMLANADPAGLCPLADAAGNSERGWIMARAMCASLGNAEGGARPLLAVARRRRVASGIDLQLAEKVVGAGRDSRQAITIEWDPVVQLTAWRFGLATATGVAIPATLYETVGPQVTGWRALAPAIPIADRAPAAEAAAAMGVVSSAALVDLYAALDAGDETPAALGAVASDLRAAYVGADVATRLSALRQLWNGAETPQARYARLILTARAAARVRPANGREEADRIVAAMLSAGLDRTAQRWRGQVEEGGDAWAMLELADPDARTRLTIGGVGNYAGKADATLKRRMFFAGLAGLGRLSAQDIESGAESLDVRIGAANPWTRALDRAVRDQQPATVILLSAIAVQTGDWRGVPPAALYRIVAGLRAVGLGGEARMIAAEALTRL
ncbi:hypothetical protein [Sphingomonas radiodurans]|uniref:hypothetical protein n=1 Tax=Sphingomonas radiodurans TaxID=2890321 RepID=UPI001E382DDA|nr:hypothetical protein [Sphingomonas radiodurans]WBH17616.1 hypothetical protein LLW23_05805 [Sphingomonas radiodurans]